MDQDWVKVSNRLCILGVRLLSSGTRPSGDRARPAAVVNFGSKKSDLHGSQSQRQKFRRREASCGCWKA